MRAWAMAMIAMLPVSEAHAQAFSYRGFTELRSILYPIPTPQDDDSVSLEGRVRFDPAVKPAPWLTLQGSLEGRMDNLGQVERSWRVDWRDRGLKRPALSVRQASATVRGRGLAVDVGKQFIRWGKADILNPTDRFAPRDFMEVTNDEFLAVTATRAQYEAGAQSLDFVWVPIFTPSRIPLVGSRWTPATPQTASPVLIIQSDRSFPDEGQFGVRWNVLAPGFEWSASFFDGFNHLPEFTTDLPDQVAPLPFVALRRSYAPLRMIGADAAVPLRWFTLKGEAAGFITTSQVADDVVIYVVQAERQSGELSLVGGYAGEVVTAKRSEFAFAPDRGLTRAFLGRAGYTLDASSEISIEAAVRQNGDGAWVKALYSRAHGAHWRITVGGAVIAGTSTDFFGQYSRNSHATLSARYSF
ncbi:MAG: hypothetical protein ND807_01250 [Vicinamibacterales bacterium]|nr:hypothetical protein [Vicinamibacterales bacterium]